MGRKHVAGRDACRAEEGEVGGKEDREGACVQRKEDGKEASCWRREGGMESRGGWEEPLLRNRAYNEAC